MNNRKPKMYRPQPHSNELMEQIWNDRGGFIGAAEEPHRIVADPVKHVNAQWKCLYCGTRFLLRPEAICNSCGLCQSCGIYHENPADTSCMCGNSLPDNAPAILRRVVRPKAQE